MDDLISRKALLAAYDKAHKGPPGGARKLMEEAPAVDAVEVDAVRAWLYEIAINNTDNYLSDACEEIISRLDGLRVFARERRDNETV